MNSAVPIRVFVQARMSSRRLPGKVLAPFRGAPLIMHVIRAVGSALGSLVPVTLITSVDALDDPLEAQVTASGVDVFRGPLDDVFERFRRALEQRPCDWVMRVNGDSPLLPPAIVRAVIERAAPDVDLVTTTMPRTFPVGMNAELIRSALFKETVAAALGAYEREHVTAHFYQHPDRYRIVNVTSGDPTLSALSLSVDSPGDLERLSRMTAAEIESVVQRALPNE